MVSGALLDDLIALTGPLEDRATTPVRGGDINDSCVLRAVDGQGYFLKLNAVELAPMFAAEAAGLLALDAAGAIRVPAVIGQGCADTHAWLLLEYLPLERGDSQAGARLGECLAQLHRCTAESFGWDRDNTIGRTPQSNTRHADWTGFFAAERLAPQLELAARHGAPADLLKLGESVLAALPALLADYEPAASLLHGDLWGGNWGQLAPGEPVIFDPAVYFGDRETDLAMTRLFGCFPPQFYDAYESAWPLAPGHECRAMLYKLYHVLNHLNLFGNAYASQAEDLMQRLLAEV